MNIVRMHRAWTAFGVVALLLTACKGDGPIVPERGILDLDPSGFTLATRLGNPDPEPFVVNVSNAAEGALGGLSAEVEYDDSSGPDWLVAELDRTDAPAQLRLQVRLAQLQVGRHVARVRVSSSASGQEAVIDFDLDLQPPPLPDVRFGTGIQAQDTLVKLGSPLRLSDFQIENRGLRPANFVLHWYHSVDAELSADDELLSEEDLSLSPVSVLEVSGVEVPTTAATPLGRQHLILVLDPDNAVEEWDESNNVAVVPFEVLGLELEVTVDGSGTVSVAPSASSYEFDVSVTLTAEPAAGWAFFEWAVNGTPAGDRNPLAFPMLRDMQLTAVFRPVVEPPTLQAQVSSSGRADLTWEFTWPCIRVGRSCETSSADGYELEMADLLAGTPFQTVYTSPNTRVTPYQHSLRVQPGMWGVRVRAVGDRWASPWSETMILDVPVPSPPAAPSNLRATATVVAGGVRFDVSWMDNADNEDSYRVQAAWDYPDFAGGAPLPANSTSYSFETSQTPGQRLYFRVEAINAQGSAQSEVAYAEVPVRDGTVRFINETDYPVFSLVVDGNEYLPGSLDAYQRGQWYQMDLPPGQYAFQMRNGIWDGSAWNPLYVWSGTVTVGSGGTVDVSFPNPSATDLMTRFSSQHTWTGGYVDPGGTIRSVATIFHADGQYSLIVDGSMIRTGTYRLVGRSPAAFMVEIQLDGTGSGTLQEALGSFTLEISPGYFVELLP